MAAFPSIQTRPGETRCDVVDRLPPALRALVAGDREAWGDL